MNRNPSEVEIGHWYTMCCILDLAQIKTEEDLKWVEEKLQEAIDDPKESVGVVTWPTLLDAVKELDDNEGLTTIWNRGLPINWK